MQPKAKGKEFLVFEVFIDGKWFIFPPTKEEEPQPDKPVAMLLANGMWYHFPPEVTWEERLPQANCTIAVSVEAACRNALHYARRKDQRHKYERRDGRGEVINPLNLQRFSARLYVSPQTPKSKAAYKPIVSGKLRSKKGAHPDQEALGMYLEGQHIDR